MALHSYPVGDDVSPFIRCVAARGPLRPWREKAPDAECRDSRRAVKARIQILGQQAHSSKRGLQSTLGIN